MAEIFVPENFLPAVVTNVQDAFGNWVYPLNPVPSPTVFSEQGPLKLADPRDHDGSRRSWYYD